MEIILYSSTVIFSSIIETINAIKTLKILAERGYKFDNLKLLSSDHILHLLFIFVPFINLIVAIKNTSDSNQLKKLSAKQLFYKKNVIPLTGEEKNLYKSNSNILNVINLNLKNHAKPNMVLVYMKDGLENTIYFTIENEINIITSTKGPISKLPRDEQYNQLQSQLKKVDFTLKSDNKINPVQKNEKKSISSSISEYEKLHILKKSLVNGQNINTEKHKVYTKQFF